MKGKHLAILLTLLLVIGSTSFVLLKRKGSTWNEAGQTGGKVIDFPISDVTSLHIKSTTGEVSIHKKDADWVVQQRADYPSDFEKVSGLVRKLWDLKAAQTQKVGPSQLGRFELNEPGKGDPAGTVVELKNKDGKSIASLLLGKKFLKKSEGAPAEDPGFPAGRYVVPVGGSNVTLVSETLDECTTTPESWLSRDFFKIENPKSIQLEGEGESRRWKITRENATADWKLEGAKADEQLDASKVSSAANAFSSPVIDDVMAPDSKPEETGLDKPSIVTIETFDHFTYVIKAGKLAGDKYPVAISVKADLPKERTPEKDEKPEDKEKLDATFKTTQKRLEEKLAKEKKFETRNYLIEKTAVEFLVKERAGLLAEKPAPEATPAPDTATTPPVAAPSTPAPPPQSSGKTKPQASGAKKK